MDRRQKKSRKAIFRAFTELLSEKNYHQITVGDIIERADIGRATFYAHFETKDFLLKELCQELFDHIFESARGETDNHGHLFDCDAPASAFLHLFQHLQTNDNHILDLLSSQNNELFLHYFKRNLTQLAQDQLSVFTERKPPALPEEFWVHHIASTFVETVRWWVEHQQKESPETITQYFFWAV